METYKTYYKLRSPKKDGTATVYVIICCPNGEELARTTGVNVHPRNYNTKTGKVSTKDILAPEKNATIQALVTDLETTGRNAQAKAQGTGVGLSKQLFEFQYAYELKHRELTTAAVKAIETAAGAGVEAIQAEIDYLEFQLKKKRMELEIMRLAAGEAHAAPRDLFVKRIDTFIATAKTLKSEKTKAQYRYLRATLARYNETVELSSINLAFLNDFQQWLVQTPTAEGKKRRNGSIRTLLTNLKAVFTYWAAELDLSTAFFSRFEMVPELANENVVYLTAAELDDLAQVPLKADLQNRVREQFLLLCETGLRHIDGIVTRSDVFTFTDSDGKENKEIRLTQEKTNQLVSIPLTPRALEILERNNYSFTPIPNNNYNQALKQICQKVPSLQHDFTVVNFNASEAIRDTRPKWAFITTKVARKTFTNHCFIHNVSETTIAAWLGHKNTAMVQKHYKHRGDVAKREAHKILV
jgi:integrase